MINFVAPLLIPLVLTTSADPQAPPAYHRMRAYVTGYNTLAAQTDDTPCIAASGRDICGRHDAIACPRRIGFGTVVEIRGTTYVCEDRLAPKFNGRFDISCDKDVECPPEVTGWATIRVYDRASRDAKPPQPTYVRLSRARPMRAGAASGWRHPPAISPRTRLAKKTWMGRQA